MKLNSLISFILITYVFCISCEKLQKSDPFSQVLNIIETNSIRLDSISWEEIKSNAIHDIRVKKKDTTIVIQDLLKQLGDNHSFYISKNKANNLNNSQQTKIEYLLIDSEIGYLNIPSFIGNNEAACRFSYTIIEKVKLLDNVGVKHWIIDLRNNDGGNMWPMLLGLSPLFDSEIAGYFMHRKYMLSWQIKNGSVLQEDQIIMYNSEPYYLKNNRSKIAILVNTKTCSSGEAVAISFTGMENVKLIGTKTCGLTTGNSVFKLDDRSVFGLTTSIFADRNKTRYGKAIIPDIETSQPLEVAVEWIKGTN
ncbi:MAG: S41 family peptidase [Bacteroidota bacterium]